MNYSSVGLDMFSDACDKNLRMAKNKLLCLKYFYQLPSMFLSSTSLKQQGCASNIVLVESFQYTNIVCA